MMQAQEYEIESATFNSKEADFSGVYLDNHLVFCSTRAKSNLSFDDDSVTMYYTDLYIARMKTNGTFSNAEMLKGNVNTDYNEGHVAFSRDGKKMYYTANLKKSLNNKFDKTSEYKLGIFYAEEINGQWINKGEFPFNSPNGKFSNAHPSLSSNDSILYFCSNRSGGKGNSDIYRCVWENNQWSEPENLGSKVNSKGNEFFPFISEFNVLYFSTNSRDDSEGMDIYYSLQEEGEFQKPVRLNNSINSVFDEFAYQELSGINQGSFSSNRNNDQDDIYFFKKYLNSFNDCHENYDANFCYHFQDEKLFNLDTLPISYEWMMGDGTILHGKTVEYCYKNFGSFHVELNVIDTITHSIFKQIGEADITISQQDKPYILCHDTVFESIPFECFAEFVSFSEFEIDHVEWELDDGSKYTGKIFEHSFNTTGNHQIKCGVTGKRKPNGVVPKICVYKNIACVVPNDEAKIKRPVACCDKREYEKIAMQETLSIAPMKSEQLKEVHKIVIGEYTSQLRKDDDLFRNSKYAITEIKTDSSYQYAIAETSTWEELLPIYKELKAAGYQKMYALELSAGELMNATNQIIPSVVTQDQKAPQLETETSLVQTTDQPKDLLKGQGTEITQASTELAPVIPAISAQIENPVSKVWYRISLLHSKERIPFNDPKFKTIKTDIFELSRNDEFEYTVMSVPQATDLSRMLVALKSGDFPQAAIDSFHMENLNKELIKTGRYIAPKNAGKLNIEFNKLSDIKFEYNSSVIKEESYKNLNYIAAMLSLEDDFILKIAAHTCSIGGANFNQQLSEDRAKSVVDYFIKKGISPIRLKQEGHGLRQPLQSNETEMGRAANRRVEFTIVFELDKH